MGKRAPQHPSKQPPSSGSRRPPQNPRAQQQQLPPPTHSPVPVGTTVGGILKNGTAKTPTYLTNTMTASSLTESHYRVNLGMSSASHSSGSNQSQSMLPENPNKSYISSTSSNSHSNSQSTNGSQKLFYTSPRCELPDAKIFPTSPVKRKSLTHTDDRWQTMSEQAGSHRQDSSVLHVSRRHMTPSVLKAGVLPQVANRIRELHLRLEQAEDLLPEWLDVISTKFQNLEHLVLTRDHPESPSAQPSRLRRLYILYRLPHLVSIDHTPVTKSERRLARPDDPNGHRVVSQEQWYGLGGGAGTTNVKEANNKDANSSKNNRKEAPKSQAKDQQQPQSSSEQKQRQTMTRSQRLKRRDNKRQSSNKQAASSDNDDYEELEGYVYEVHQRGNDNDRIGSDEQPMSLSEVVSESGEGYELDLVLADAIQRITDPNNKIIINRPTSPMSPTSPTRRKIIRDEAFIGKNLHKHKKAAKPNSQPSSFAKKPTSPNKRGSNNNNNIGNNNSKPTSPTKGALVDHKDDDDEHDENGDPTVDPTVEYVEDDSTVTSAYGYGHWSGACFAPFQLCTTGSQQRKKTKQNFAARNKQSHGFKPPKAITAAIDTKGRKNELAITSDLTPGTPPSNHPTMDSQSSPQLSAKVSSKYSSMVDETNQKQQSKQRRRLFRESTTSASRGGSTSAPSSKRSHKYSKLLVEMNAAHAGVETAKMEPPEARQTKEDLQQVKQVPQSKSQPKSAQQSQPQKQASRQPQKQQKTQELQKSPPGALQISNKAKALTKALSLATMDEDEVGTMTGVSIAVVKDANSGMSVATIPSVLKREAIKYDLAKNKSKAVSEGESLAARRNLAGVTIDVPPPTPNEARSARSDPPASKSKATKAIPQSGQLEGNERSQAQGTQGKDDSKPKQRNSSQNQKESEKEASVKRDKMEAKQSMDSLEGPTDPEIVDMVLSKLGKNFQTTPSLQGGVKSGPKSDSQLKGTRETNVRFQVETGAVSVPGAAPADLQFPRLTPTSEQTRKEKSKKVQQQELPANGAHNEESLGNQERDPTAFEARGTRMSSKAKKAKGSKKKAAHSQGQVQSSSEEESKGEEHSTCSEGDDEEESNGSDDPASSESRTSDSQGESSSSDSGSRSTKENFHELENRLDNLIQNTNTRLPSALRSSSAIPLSPENSPKLSAAEQKLMAETVNKLDENLRSILELQNSPEKRVSPSASERRRRMQQQRGNKSDTHDGVRKQETVNSTPGNTEVSPLEKLETTMAGLFASIMAQMSPPRRLLTPAAATAATSNPIQSSSPKKEKRRDEFFPARDAEKSMKPLESNDDDSTLFVVEIERKDVSESITNDYNFQPRNGRAGVEAPSVVHLLDPSVQSSVTAFQASRTQNRRTQNNTAESISPFHEATHEFSENPEAYFDHEIPVSPSDAATAPPQMETTENDIPQLQDTNPVQDKKDPTIIELIDLTDKSTIATNKDANDPSVINLVDMSVKSKAQSSKDDKPVENSAKKPGELMMPSLEHAEKSAESPPATTQSDTGGNGKSLGISQQGSKLGMVVNLPTVFENTPASVSVDGYCVAAAAAGAAAGAEASGDDGPGTASDQTVAAETDCPSDQIPTNQAIVDGKVAATAHRPSGMPPKEITTTPSTNPILAVLQTPINGRDIRSSNLPSEVMVQNDREVGGKTKDPPALLADLLTAKPKDSNLSMLSRRQSLRQKLHQPMTPNSARFPNESPVRAEREDFARRDSPPSPKDTGPKLPREIIALLQEKEISSSADAIALLPSEIVMRIEKTMSESGYYAQVSPGSASNDHNSADSNLVSIPEDILVMLNQFDRTGGGGTNQFDSPALTDRAKLSLPKEVLALLMPRSSNDEMDGIATYDDAQVTQSTPTDETVQEMSWYLIKSRPQFEETIAYLGQSDSGDDGHASTARYGLSEELNLAKQHILTSSYKMQQSDGDGEADYSEDYSRFQQNSGQPLRNESYDESHVENHSAPPHSLPSRIAVNRDPPAHNSAFLPSLPSKVAVNENDEHQSQHNSGRRPPSLPSNVAVKHAAHQSQQNSARPPSFTSNGAVNNDTHQLPSSLPSKVAVNHATQQPQDKSALPSSLPSKIAVDHDAQPQGTTATKPHPQRDYQDDGSHLQRPASLPSRVMVKAEPAAAAAPQEDDSHSQLPSSLPSKVMVKSEGADSPATNKAVSPAKSLSSPFPMQFRSRLAKSLKVATPKSSAPTSTAKPAPVVEGMSVMSSNQDGAKPSASSLPKQITVDANTKQPPLPPINVETIASPRVFKPVASPLLKSRAKKVVARSNGELPPHNPASSRRSVSSISPRSDRMNRAISRWKHQRKARSNSIMDGDDHEDEDEDDNDNNDDGGHNDEATADNENVSYTE